MGRIRWIHWLLMCEKMCPTRFSCWFTYSGLISIFLIHAPHEEKYSSTDVWNQWLLNLFVVITEIHFPISLLISIQDESACFIVHSQYTSRPSASERKREEGRRKENLLKTGLHYLGTEEGPGRAEQASLCSRM